MDHSTLIDDLGGAKALGDALRARNVEVEDVTVRSWKLPGRFIPAKYWTHVVAIATERNIVASCELLAKAVAA